MRPYCRHTSLGRRASGGAGISGPRFAVRASVRPGPQGAAHAGRGAAARPLNADGAAMPAMPATSSHPPGQRGSAGRHHTSNATQFRGRQPAGRGGRGRGPKPCQASRLNGTERGFCPRSPPRLVRPPRPQLAPAMPQPRAAAGRAQNLFGDSAPPRPGGGVRGPQPMSLGSASALPRRRDLGAVRSVRSVHVAITPGGWPTTTTHPLAAATAAATARVNGGRRDAGRLLGWTG